MDGLLTRYLNQMIEFEEKGYIAEALKLADKLLETFPGDRADILLEKAKMQFRNGDEKSALFDFIDAYEASKDKDIYELILEAYYEPNKELFQQMYNHNMYLLKKYPHYRNDFDFDSLDFVPVWHDQEVTVCLDLETGQFGVEQRGHQSDLLTKSGSVMLLNELWLDDIKQCEARTRMDPPFLDMEYPLYAVFDKVYWMLFAQLYDIKLLLQTNRIVFLAGRQCFRDYFYEDMVVFPDFVAANIFQSEYHDILQQIVNCKDRESLGNVAEIQDYYKKNITKFHQRIKEKKPRVLFWTSRFTTVLQYHTRDCMQAAHRLGCDTKLLIEKDGIHRIGCWYSRKAIAEFKPDIIFMLDHFRFEHNGLDIPDELIWITWVQDLLPRIMSKNTPSKLTVNDFVMNHFTTWNVFHSLGYDKKRLIDAPIPADSKVYKPYVLSGEEKERYACDICFVCHAADVDSYIQGFLLKFPEELREPVCAVYKGYQSYAYEEGTFFYTEDVFACFIDGALRQNYQMALPANTIKFLAEDMYSSFNQRVYRQVLVDWILDAGFTNVKLWGNGWITEEKYRNYAMGPAENGETLSKIYQASKVVIGNNVMTTAAARAWETMLSGGFYMSNYIPEDADVTDIRKIIDIDKDVVMFYNKNDLIQKIHYYLEHEDERTNMIKRGRKAALEKMTFDKLMEKTLNTVAEDLEEREYERQN